MARIDLVTVEEKRIGSVVIDNHAAVAIENFAARGEQRSTFYAISFGGFDVALGILHLELPKPRY